MLESCQQPQSGELLPCLSAWLGGIHLDLAVGLCLNAWSLGTMTGEHRQDNIPIYNTPHCTFPSTFPTAHILIFLSCFHFSPHLHVISQCRILPTELHHSNMTDLPHMYEHRVFSQKFNYFMYQNRHQVTTQLLKCSTCHVHQC
jgi:hypothetical protein